MTQTDNWRSEVVHGHWRGGVSGLGYIESGDLSCSLSAPPDIGGSGLGESPSSLLIAGASACFLLTLAALLEQSGISVVKLSVETEGVFRGSARPELCALIHRPRVILHRSEASRLDRIRRCFAVAKDSCMAARALRGVSLAVEGVTWIDLADNDLKKWDGDRQPEPLGTEEKRPWTQR